MNPHKTLHERAVESAKEMGEKMARKQVTYSTMLLSACCFSDERRQAMIEAYENEQIRRSMN